MTKWARRLSLGQFPQLLHYTVTSSRDLMLKEQIRGVCLTRAIVERGLRRDVGDSV